ncbi:MAG: RluA family pseudouridine synthase [Desulfatiglans sp.]|nr:RluA family pseudouridine synthase [Desulfatiglans sp.]
MENAQERKCSFQAETADIDLRIDSFLSAKNHDLTRSRIQALIRDGHIKVNKNHVKPSYRLRVGDIIELILPPSLPYQLNPEPLNLSIIYEDSYIIVLDKPPGLVIHPAPGHKEGTLVHGLIYHCNDLSGIGGVMRPGIVHRLDRNTSGLLVVAKNDKAHNFLSSQFKNGLINKRYFALVHDIPEGVEGRIDLPISRNPIKRKEMTVSPKGKRAITEWRIEKPLSDRFALLSVTIKTGRTHQIRVHMSHIGHPVVGDPVYGYKNSWWRKNNLSTDDIQDCLKRQMLHSAYLAFIHPDTEKYVEFHAPIPADMELAIKKLGSFPIKI